MRWNESKMLSFQITNNGHDETGEITINVPEVDWMSVMSGSTLPSIAIGDTSSFTIQLFPGDNVSLTQYEGSIAVNCANGNGIAIPYVIEATNATTGTLVVDVTDDYTFNTNGGFGPHLAGAQVTVTGYYSLDVVAQGLTDENGLFTVETLPEGYYVLDVQAPNHNEYNRGVIYIEAGQTNHQDIYLQFQAISYSWVVVPTEVEDEYELELVCNIKTNVPVPVVVIEGPSTFDTLAYGETLQYNITVSNYGLIDAYDAQITLPTIGEYVFTPLFDVIDTIHANSTVIIPCTMTRIFGDREAPCNKGINEVLTWYHCSNKAEWVRHEQNIKINIPWFHCDGFSLLVGNPQPPILPPVGPPHIPPVGPPPPYPPTPTPPPHITVLPTITPDFQLPEIASDSDGDCTPCWKVALSTAIHIATAYFKIPYVAGALDCLIYEAKADDFVNMLKASMMIASPIAGLAYQYITKDYIKFSSDLTKCVANVGLGVLGDKKGGTPFKIYDTANEIIEMGNRIGECITLNPNREDSQLGIVVEQFVKSGACFKSYMDELVNLFPEEEWLHEERLDLFLDNFTAVIDTISGIVMPQSTENLIAISELSVVNDTLVQRFVDRWNRSVMYWNEGFFKVEDLPQGFDCNFIQLDTMRFAPVQQAISMAESYGFSSVLEMFESSLDYLSGQSIEHSNDVCSKVSVKFKQTMAMTREAFEGTLKIYNGHTTDPMENIQVNMVIKNEEGVDCTNLFQINVSSLDQVTGIDGSGSLNAQQEGVIQLTMIPTIAAAPETPRVYSFGGSFSFLDPFSGEVVTYPLYPVELTVNPSPELHVDYFVQRHIISDDPLTEDTIEMTEPAEIAIMIRNVGMGDANNVYLESSQPEIIENQNGLLIQFDLVGSAMNGEQRPLGLTNIPFGIIPAQTAGIAEWYFTSSLMARVIQSTPHLIHNNSYGNPDLSLVTELHSHDLIKAVRAYSSLDDNIHDFLVNETPDFSHIPDMLYFSNGGTASVKRVIGASTEGTLSETNTTVLLNLNSVDAGWNYAYVEDPAQGQYELVCCTRDDGQIIPLDNVWITHVTMFDDDAPIHENILHILDTMSVGRNYCYTLMYAIESETPAVTTQSIILAKGWNWFSSYLECDDNSLFNLENELANNVNAAVVKSQSDGFVNLDENGWMGSMTDLVNEQMYQILVQQATEISMTGARVNPLNHPITLTSGWNWIGYLSTQTMSLDDALASLTPLENDVIKGQVSFSSYSEEEGWLGSLTTLQPGQG